MNEDDYNFDFTDNSRLSMLFRMDYKAGDSSLTYKAPKQPSSSKTFHKYIRLYHGHNGKLYGKYIIAIVTVPSNVAELLIYQTKTNIFLRQPVVEQVLYTHIINNFLFLNATNKEQYKLEFENEKDLLDFTQTYVQAGGCVESFERLKLSHVLTEIDNLEIFEGKERDDRERSISTFKEKLDAPNRISFEKGLQNIIFDKNVANDKHLQDGVEKSINLKTCPSTSDDSSASTKNNFHCAPTNLTQEQTNLLTTVLLDNQSNNSKLREAIYLLTSKLEEIIPCKEIEKLEVKNLESRIKSLELKSENLQLELNNFNKQNKNSCEISCQTHNLGYISNEAIHLRSIVIQAMDIMKSFTFTPDRITELRNWAEKIEDDQLVSSLQPYFNLIEGKDSSETENNFKVLRNQFVAKLKETMNDMYQNICNSEQNVDFENLFAEQIKLATVEIVHNFDNCLQQKKE